MPEQSFSNYSILQRCCKKTKTTVGHHGPQFTEYISMATILSWGAWFSPEEYLIYVLLLLKIVLLGSSFRIWWLMIDDWLMNNFLMIFLWLIDDWLMIDWLLIDDCLMIDWWLIDKWLMIYWWLIDGWLMIDWWLIDDSLTIDWWLIDDWLIISWMALSQFWLCLVINIVL